MALKFLIDRLEDVDERLREHYGPTDGGKYILDLQGESPKVAEFREKNIALLKDLARFEGIDPDAATAALVRVKELEQANPDDRVKALETELASEKAARTAAQQTAADLLLREQLQPKMLAAGILPGALDIALTKASALFTIQDGMVHARPDKFSPTRPGESLTLDEWIAGATREFSFLFGPSSGSGADPKPGGGGGTNVHELRNPTPQQLGEFAADIKSGKVKIVHSS